MNQELMDIVDRGKILMLKIAVCIVGITVLVLCIYWLPWQANVFADMYPEFIHLKYPLLIGIYMTAIPFFFALFQVLKLLGYIDKNKAFSELSITSIKYIKFCAITISAWYVAGIVTLISQNAGNPGILLIGLVIFFASIVIAVFATVLQKLCKNAVDIKSENDLMI
ncbi:DUF2975 domain-containing protein [Neobacillus sp. SAB-20_R2A]|uniref:DUF2975 domain-containing protein n=1 Tax=Neobacillus sp. SAB-20_R2A TaxID=3120519 RepID=UPI003C6DE2AA